MGTVDTVVAGRLGAAQLAGVAVGANIWFLLFVLVMGLFMAVSPIVAQRTGARRPPAEIGGFLRSALLLASAIGLCWMAAVLALTPQLLGILQLEPAVHDYAAGYLRAIAPGAIPYTLFFALRNAAEGHGLTRPTLAAGLIGFTANAVLAYGLGHGALGFPALGPAGIGTATAIAATAMCLAYAALYRVLPALRPVALYRRGLGAGLAEILRLGGPIALILAAEAWLFQVGSLLVARFGEHVMAAHQIAFNFTVLVFMVPMSLGLATTVRVGQAVGAGAPAEARLRGQAGIALGAAFALLSASLMAGLPELIAGAYTTEPGLVPAAVNFLYLAALFQVFDCIQATANGALRGLKDTRVPMYITVAAYWLVGFPLAAGLTFGTDLGPAGVWCGFIAGLAAAAAGLGARFAHQTRRSLHIS